MEELIKAVSLAKETLVSGLATSERALEHAVVLPILRALSWNSDDPSQMRPEYTVGSGRVDWALCATNKPCVFLEEKAPDQTLNSHEEQLLQYAFAQGIGLSILTNGAEWWFYLPLSEGQWKDRRFASVDLLQHDLEHVCKYLHDFLEYSNVCSGKARATAEQMHECNREEARIRERLPQVIKQIIISPSTFIIEVFQSEAQNQLGALPSADHVKHALRAVLTLGDADSGSTTAVPTVNRSRRETPPPPPPRSKANRPAVTGVSRSTTTAAPAFSKPTAMVIGGDRMPVRTWAQVLTSTAIWLTRKGYTLPIGPKPGSKRPLISNSDDAMAQPRRIENGLYVETNFSASDHYKHARWLLQQVGLRADDLVVEYEERST